MPDRQEKKYEQLLRDAGCSEKVLAHCKAVYDVALEYAQRDALVDVDLVREGAMLHDIGRGSSHTILHAQRGADLLRAQGISEEVARIVECHTGAGLTADECTLLRLSPRDCMPRTTEEKIVTHADNLIEGRKRVIIDESIASAIHLPKKVRQRIYHLAQDVELLCS
ncbi:MAG: HDIG domain-containing protein [Methanoregula sp.]|nr:HDIG domain-containing protein [Methanoregula sp.]